MALQEVTLDLPEAVYNQIRQAAKRANRPIRDVLVEAVVAAAPVVDAGPDDLRSALAQMAYLNDAVLWQMARSTLTAEQRGRLQALHDKQQRDGLTDDEQTEEQHLVHLYQETLLVRA